MGMDMANVFEIKTSFNDWLVLHSLDSLLHGAPKTPEKDKWSSIYENSLLQGQNAAAMKRAYTLPKYFIEDMDTSLKTNKLKE